MIPNLELYINQGGLVRIGRHMGTVEERPPQTAKEKIEKEIEELEMRVVGNWRTSEIMSRYLELKRKLAEMK